MQFQTLEPATHAYSFWEGIPLEGRAAFGRLFAASRSLRGVVVVQRAMRGDEPAAVMADLGFGPLLLLTSFAVTMSGSGASFQAGFWEGGGRAASGQVLGGGASSQTGRRVVGAVTVPLAHAGLTVGMPGR